MNLNDTTATPRTGNTSHLDRPRAAGYRVARTDLRGHGDSDATFSSYGDEETAADVTALICELGGPAVIVGNSMAAGSAVLAAAQHPGLVSDLVLVAGSRLRRSGGGGGLDRAGHRCAGRHGARGRALSPVAAPRHHHRRRPALPGHAA
jgi:pimeloyl-ACP methyl ester carboxylesterase